MRSGLVDVIDRVFFIIILQIDFNTIQYNSIDVRRRNSLLVKL